MLMLHKYHSNNKLISYHAPYYSRHGDILPDGGVLLSMVPTTAEEEAKYLSRPVASQLQSASSRLNITGGFLLYEENEDVAGINTNVAAAEYVAHSERLKSTNSTPTMRKASARGSKGLRKSNSAYNKSNMFTGASTNSLFITDMSRLSMVATLDLANDKEYNNRMLTLGKNLANSRHKTTKQTQAALTLDRYKLSVQELYGTYIVQYSAHLTFLISRMHCPI